MPPINTFSCSHCDLTFPKGWGGYMYVSDDKGNKVVCPHPVEHYTIAKVLGVSGKDAFAWLLNETNKVSPEVIKLIEDRIGINSDCICLDCLTQFGLDVVKEKRICPKCGQDKIQTVGEMIGKPCPKCHQGKIEKHNSGLMS